MGFIDQVRAEGHAAWSIIRVLREQDVKVAARTYRAWRQGRVSTRTVTDAMVVDAVRDAAWRVDELPDGTTRRRMTPEGLYGRKKMTALSAAPRQRRHSWRGGSGDAGPRAGRDHAGEGDPHHDPLSSPGFCGGWVIWLVGVVGGCRGRV